MALQPNRFMGKHSLQPGGRGEIFQANLPGYRDGEDRINRTMTRLNMNEHDVPNIKYMLDDRLPELFRYGFTFGFNNIVLPKGRIVAVDPDYTMVDFDMQKEHNVLTIANGGVSVKVRQNTMLTDYNTMATTTKDGAKLVSEEVKNIPGASKEWAPVDTFAAHYPDGKLFTTGTSVGLSEAVSIDELCQKAIKNGETVRIANTPIGILERNEYTRDEDAFNGMMPGPIRTDAMVELPYFLHKDKAEQNPWGSAYGALKPGMIVKSDENGRVVKSPLSDATWLAAATAGQIEIERQQAIGQVFEVKNDLIPEGAAVYAQWAIEEILNFNEFNPDEWRQTNRSDADVTKQSPHNSTGEYPGYPYEKAYKNHDLHMLESYRKTYDQRMQHQHRFDYGIPGLTDGYNAVKNTVTDENVGQVNYAGEGKDYVDVHLRMNDTRIDGDLEIITTIGEKVVKTAIPDNGVGTVVKAGDNKDMFTVKYANYLQGYVVLTVDKEKAKEVFDANIVEGKPLPVEFGFTYTKRGQAGVPTFMDWDGCSGSVKILLQK